MAKRIRLGVNIDHVATLREVRKASYPDILEAAKLAKDGGADQITVHLREDRRHIQDRDVIDLLKKQNLPVNLEMAFTDEMISFACKAKPYSVTLVPERRAEMTTESGLDLRVIDKKRVWLKRLSEKTKIHGFIDPDPRQVRLASALGLVGVEFHTGTFAHSFEWGNSTSLKREVERLRMAAFEASNLQLEVKAGHGLTLENVRLILNMPKLVELNIGHSLVARAISIGLKAAVREMKQKLVRKDAALLSGASVRSFEN
jgi:pyridoxine 5-phosphate synthase